MIALASNKRRLKCPVCERTIERKSRQQNFCSTRCRMRVFREKMPARSGYTGGVTNPQKSSNENNVLQWPKTRSSLSCNDPLNLLGGGSWQWPSALRIDSKTLAKIRHSEIGGELLMPPQEAEQ
jgi:hypothetical protein